MSKISASQDVFRKPTSRGNRRATIRYGCTPANRHCERCRQDECGGPCYDYRRNFNYPWYPPYHSPIWEEVPPDFGPRIIPLEHSPPEELPEELPAPKPRRPEELSPSDKPKRRG